MTDPHAVFDSCIRHSFQLSRPLFPSTLPLKRLFLRACEVLTAPSPSPLLRAQSEPDVCRMKVHICGSVCSPVVCAYVLSREAKIDFAVQELYNQFFVGNLVTSFHREEEAVSGARKLTRALKKGGFKLAPYRAPPVGPSWRRCLDNQLRFSTWTWMACQPSGCLACRWILRLTATC